MINLPISSVAALVVKIVAFRDEAFLTASNRTDEGAFPFVDPRVSLQVLAFRESLPAPRKLAAERLGTIVKVHVVDQTNFSLKSLPTAQIRTLIELFFLLCLSSAVKEGLGV